MEEKYMVNDILISTKTNLKDLKVVLYVYAREKSMENIGLYNTA